MNTLAPLEFVVVRTADDQFGQEVLPVLVAMQQAGTVRVVDLLFIRRDAAGAVTARELHECDDETLRPYGELVNELQGLLTADDIITLASDLPAGDSAVVVLLEHRWAQQLGDAVARTKGTILAGGLVPADTLMRVNLELAAVPA